jgi:hypothetical protein
MAHSCFTPARLLAAVMVRRNKFLKDESELSQSSRLAEFGGLGMSFNICPRVCQSKTPRRGYAWGFLPYD